MKLRAVIFDLDGTLVDSVDGHTKSWQQAFVEFGKTVDYDTLRGQIGKGGDQLLPAFLTSSEVQEVGDRIAQRKDEIFKQNHLSEVRAFPGARALIEKLMAEKMSLALASSGKDEDVAQLKKHAQIADLLETETTKDDASRSKPHPDILQAAMERLGNPSLAETILIGDTIHDIEAARRAGLGTIAFRCGGAPEASLQGAIAIYDGPADLLSRYAQSPLVSEG